MALPQHVQYRYRPWTAKTSLVLEKSRASNHGRSSSAGFLDQGCASVTDKAGGLRQGLLDNASPDQFNNAIISTPANASQRRQTSTPLLAYDSPAPSCSSWSSSDSNIWSDACNGPWTSLEVGPNHPLLQCTDFYNVDGTSIPQAPEMVPCGSCSSMEDVQPLEYAPSSDQYALFNDTFESGYSNYTNFYSSQPGLVEDQYSDSFVYSDASISNGYAQYAQYEQQTQKRDTVIQGLEKQFTASASGVRKQRALTQPHTSPSPAPLKISKRRSTTAVLSSACVELAPRELKKTQGVMRRTSRPSQPSATFPCPLAPYGCTSAFGSKNEWKRHVNTQHLRLDLWRCDQCEDRVARPNDFNRKDLFIQHLRRMHYRMADGGTGTNDSKSTKTKSLTAEDTDPSLLAAEKRCHLHLRQPPANSSCLFCPAVFSGPGSWEERMEHVGRHLEQTKREGKEVPDIAAWKADPTLEAYLECEGLIVWDGLRAQLTDGGRSSPRQQRKI